MKKITLLSAAFLFTVNLVFPQGTAINTTGAAADQSALLDLSSTTKGIVIPRMTTAQRNAIVSPVNGLMIFNTDCNNFSYYNGADWAPVNSSTALATPAAIAGSADVCSGQTGVSYNVSAVSGAKTYIWTLPSGATITSGPGTNSITVTFGTSGGAVCVQASDSCGASASSCLNVALSTSVPPASTTSAGTGISQNQFIANWTSSGTATHYHLDVAGDALFTSILSSYNNINVGTNTSYIVGGLNCNTTYYYRVKSENGCGSASYSNTTSVSTSTCPMGSGCTSTWTSKAEYPDGGIKRNYMTGFGIGSKVYIGTGASISPSVFFREIWELDPNTNTWTQKADFGSGSGDARGYAVAFSLNGKGYIGTGYSASGMKKDLWEYDATLNTWTKKADMPAAAPERYYAVAMTIGSKAYIGTGWDASNNCLKDFYEYNPATDSWTKKADLTGLARSQAVGFGIGTKGYIGTGWTCSGNTDTFYEYNPSTNTWTQRDNYPGGSRWGAVGFSLSNNKGYLGLGYISTTPGVQYYTFYEYNNVSNKWYSATDFYARPGGLGMFSFGAGARGYIGGGEDYNGYLRSDVWEFCPN